MNQKEQKLKQWIKSRSLEELQLIAYNALSHMIDTEDLRYHPEDEDDAPYHPDSGESIASGGVDFFGL